MLIVCPTCATSYMIDPASVGPTGRAVRCARCKATWFATPGKPAGPPSVSAFVDGVIAEAEAEAQGAPSPPPPVFDAPPSAPPSLPRAESPFAPEPQGFDTEARPENDTHQEQAFDHGTALPDTINVSDSPPLAPHHDEAYGDGGNAFFSGPAPHDAEDGASFTARRARLKAKLKKDGRKSRWIAVIVALIAFNIALIGGRSYIVRHLPQTASLFAAIGLPVNLRNLEFEDIAISKETQDGVSILIIEGRIVNTSRKAADVPRLRFAARTAAGQEVYTWTMQPPRTILGPGDSMPFTSRLAAPPANAADVLVRFFTTQDVNGGLK
ncbi:MJ0042-type zinc finger domain-containing protein [Undibacter mobilis]|uniref:Zinc finger/thioredoxin putative domain-containing protein n=1 Tax=Undibacter mobilis TaxID=2292256 RepID=A0A371B7Q3_9BRAD|nr:MJ0042-type zinc finger domain-containing protein [Undibacter mobilis]RDV03527.1 hypothetical protein DXH78_02350 [Undibacter mobilis]